MNAGQERRAEGSAHRVSKGDESRVDQLSNELIICLASANWDAINRVNCHHVMARLAERNDVLFVETTGGRPPRLRDWSKVLHRLRRAAVGHRAARLPARMSVVTPLLWPNYGSPTAYRLNTALLKCQILRSLPTSWRQRPRLLWAFLPYHAGLVGQLGEQLVVYHCVDEYAENPNVPKAFWHELEGRLARQAHLVLTTSNTLYAAKAALNRETYYLPNVADTAHFERALEANIPVPSELATIPQPIAGFVGNLASYKVRLSLLHEAAMANPGWSFVFIGPVGHGEPEIDLGELRECPNVYLLGPRAYSELPGYVKGFTACLIPYDRNESTNASFPMKFFEYLAVGKPVVSTDLPALREFRWLYYSANDAQQMSEALGLALRTPFDARRIEIARQNSWDRRMTDIERLVGRRLGETRAAIAAES